MIEQLRPLADQRTSLTILGVEFHSTGNMVIQHMPDTHRNVLAMTLEQVHRG